MADTLPSVALRAGTWIDIYDSTGLDVGTKISVQNIGTDNVLLVTSANTPAINTGRSELLAGGQWLTNEFGASGAWAMSPSIDGLINITRV